MSVAGVTCLRRIRAAVCRKPLCRRNERSFPRCHANNRGQGIPNRVPEHRRVNVAKRGLHTLGHRTPKARELDVCVCVRERTACGWKVDRRVVFELARPRATMQPLAAARRDPWPPLAAVEFSRLAAAESRRSASASRVCHSCALAPTLACFTVRRLRRSRGVGRSSPNCHSRVPQRLRSFVN
jgi:hypothetical protein